VSASCVHAAAVYLPAFRLRVDGWGLPRVTASYDEDATSMAVEAARRALDGGDGDVDRIVFVTTSPAYLEKNAASTIHAALGLPASVGAYDAGGALRSTVGALVSALESPQRTLVVAADLQVALPGSGDERDRADGAAAILTAPESDQSIAGLLSHAAGTFELLERWRDPTDAVARASDERFIEHVYKERIRAAVADAAERADVEPKAVRRGAAAGATQRVLRSAGAAAGMDRESWLPAPPIGNLGAAQPLFELIRLLAATEAGDTAALVVAADGVDALLLRRYEGELCATLPRGRDDLPYLTYLAWKGLLPPPGSRRPDPDPPAPAPSLRSTAWKFSLHAGRCSECGFVALPPQRICPGCGRTGTSAPYPLANRQATIASTMTDLLARGSASPPLMTATVDFDGGGRGSFELTDVWADELPEGARVEPTFRRFYSSEGISDYFWKLRPAPEAD